MLGQDQFLAQGGSRVVGLLWGLATHSQSQKSRRTRQGRSPSVAHQEGKKIAKGCRQNLGESVGTKGRILRCG